MLRLRGKLPQSVKEARTIAAKRTALQTEVDRAVEGLGEQLTATSERAPGEEVRRVTCLYSEAHQTWHLQAERGEDDMSLAEAVLKKLAANQQSQPQPSQPPPQGKGQTAQPATTGAPPAAGGRPGSADLRKPGGPPEDSTSRAPGSVVTGG